MLSVPLLAWRVSQSVVSPVTAHLYLISLSCFAAIVKFQSFFLFGRLSVLALFSTAFLLDIRCFY